jgi:hypothetical protein
LILSGSLTITYPEEKNAEKVTYGVGDRIDVEEGRVHEVCSDHKILFGSL